MEKTNTTKKVEVINDNGQKKVAEKDTGKKTASKKNKIIKGVIIGGVSAFLAFVIAVVSIIAIVISVTRVSLEDYMLAEPQYVGVNGYGSVDAGALIDYDALDGKITDDDYDEYSWFYGGYTTARDYISITYPENNGRLSNGDEIEITINIDKEGMKNNSGFKKTISGSDTQTFKYTVSGLSEAVVVDAFDIVEKVVYDTVSGSKDIYVKQEYTRDYGNGVSAFYEYGQLKISVYDNWVYSTYIEMNYDELQPESQTVTLYIDAAQDEFATDGFIFEAVEKEFELNVISRLKSENISETELKTLKTLADNYMDDNIGEGKHNFQKANGYFTSNDDGKYLGVIVFYYTVDGKTYGVYFEGLKQDQTGSIYKLDEAEAKSIKTWLFNEMVGYDSAEKFEEANIYFESKVDITIPN